MRTTDSCTLLLAEQDGDHVSLCCTTANLNLTRSLILEQLSKRHLGHGTTLLGTSAGRNNHRDSWLSRPESAGVITRLACTVMGFLSCWKSMHSGGTLCVPRAGAVDSCYQGTQASQGRECVDVTRASGVGVSPTHTYITPLPNSVSESPHLIQVYYHDIPIAINTCICFYRDNSSLAILISKLLHWYSIPLRWY